MDLGVMKPHFQRNPMGILGEVGLARPNAWSPDLMKCLRCMMLITGWWFGTFFYFSIGNSNPNWLIFFRGVGQPPTRWCVTIMWEKWSYPLGKFRETTAQYDTIGLWQYDYVWNVLPAAHYRGWKKIWLHPKFQESDLTTHSKWNITHL